uniref:DUF2721 domain-containing protein n=1 Tax=uncultured Shewanella sp. TaxID=173975 RepID=UPI002624F66B
SLLWLFGVFYLKTLDVAALYKGTPKVLCMIFIYAGLNHIGSMIFGCSLLLLLYSLILSVIEIRISVDALNIHLKALEKNNFKTNKNTSSI